MSCRFQKRLLHYQGRNKPVSFSFNLQLQWIWTRLFWGTVKRRVRIPFSPRCPLCSSRAIISPSMYHNCIQTGSVPRCNLIMTSWHQCQRRNRRWGAFLWMWWWRHSPGLYQVTYRLSVIYIEFSWVLAVSFTHVNAYPMGGGYRKLIPLSSCEHILTINFDIAQFWIEPIPSQSTTSCRRSQRVSFFLISSNIEK